MGGTLNRGDRESLGATDAEVQQPHRLANKKPRFRLIPPPKLTPVLLAGDAHYSILAAVRALRAAGYAPWLAVNEPGTYAAHSRVTAGTVPVPDPGLDAEGFVRELAAAAIELSVAAVLPGAEVHVLVLAGREADFAGIAALGTPSRQSVERATGKDLLHELAEAAGLQTPPTVKVARGEAASTFGFPAIVKPLRSFIRVPDGTARVTRYHARYVSDEREAEEALEALPGEEGLLQPYVPGQLVSVSGVCWEGELICALHQLSIRIWPVPAGGSSYAQTIPPDLQLEWGVGRLLRATGWSGPFQAQFVRDPRGEHHLIDLNPRLYGSLALALGAGLNLPGIWTDLLLGRQPEVGPYRVGARYRHEEKDARALGRMLAGGGGERRRALWGLVPRRGTTHAIFSLRDPMPLLVSAAKLAGRLGRQAR